jgi:methionyl-tRNA formyltransferase
VVDATLRIVFFGTPAFALVSLDALLRSRHEVVGVVTQPDRPRGRGQRTSDAPVKARAVTVGLPVLQPTRLRDDAFSGELAALEADVGVVAAYGRILPESTLTSPRLGMVNVHASLLPRYRGAAPVHRAVMAGETETGVTIMRLVKALDAGPMLSSARRPIGPDETSEEVERGLASLGALLLVSVLDRLAAGTSTETPQNDALATYAPPLRKEEGLINWMRSAGVIHNLVRGLHPWPHAFTFLNGRRVILRRSRPAGDAPHAEPGTLLAASHHDLSVVTGAGRLQLLELQPEGKRPMSAQEFLSGHRLTPGDRFTSP